MVRPVSAARAASSTFHGAGAVAVGAAAVGADQQRVGVRVAARVRPVPPAADACRPRTRRCRGRCPPTPTRCWRPRRRPRTGWPCPARGSRKSCTLTGSGSPLGCHSRPPFLKSPTSSFFLVSTLITGCPAARCVADLLVEVAELGVAVGMLAALDGLGVGLQAEPHRSRSSRATVRSLTGCPCRGQRRRPASRVDFDVHRNGDIGSPRVSGSTNAENVGHQLRVGLGQPLAPTARRADPRRRLGQPVEFPHSPSNGVRVHTGRRGDRLDAAPTKLLGLHPEQQAPLPLVQVRAQRRVLRRHRLRHTGHYHNRSRSGRQNLSYFGASTNSDVLSVSGRTVLACWTTMSGVADGTR